MDYLKTVVPSQFVAERGDKLVVINPGSANIKIGLATQDVPLIIPHCIARRTAGANVPPRKNVIDQMLNHQVTTSQHVERERAYDTIASFLKIPSLNEEVSNSYSRKMARLDGSNLPTNKVPAFTWTDVVEKKCDSSSTVETSVNNDVMQQSSDLIENAELKEAAGVSGRKYREFICGEEALKISPTEPYCLRRPIRRGHFNVSPYYPAQQVLEDLHALWEWILTEKLHIPLSRRNMYSALLVVPETFDNREIKELLSIVLGDLQFNVAVVHQEALATVFGNGLSTACVVNIGAQATSVICVEDGVTLPTTEITLSFGGEDISRCMLWTQRHHQTWPPIRTDAVAKPIDLLMLNRLKESYCQIKESEIDAVAVVHSYEDGMPAVAHKIRLTALNVAPMGLFYPKLLVPEVYPPPPRTWYHDYEDMLEDTSNLEYPRRPDGSDLYPGFNGGLPMWETYPIVTNKPKKLENIGLAEAITKSILSTGRIDLQRKLFCSIQLGGGVSLTNGLVAAVEDRVLHAIPPNEAIDTVEVLPSRHDPAYVSWKGGVLLGILDFTHEAWIHRLDWVSGGLYVGSKRKYRESYYIQAQPMCYMNS
ncbi:actin-related protein 9 isoform X1 [Beta vulgaris subsp. vulgaris]|uniref:actin-related protein 9 isoform X1 n=2 Tax=Beta vulgaris subsp. vulgaris TaxID=3555 RepID=UPI002036A05F|nr:actin-related protein 9 isoform X1 [Beta vulgaris subsp. vulgaris]